MGCADNGLRRELEEAPLTQDTDIGVKSLPSTPMIPAPILKGVYCSGAYNNKHLEQLNAHPMVKKSWSIYNVQLSMQKF